MLQSNSDIILNKYVINEVLGKGKFGTVYKGKIIKSGEHIAIKMESLSSPTRMLKHEATILNYLYSNGCRCIPYVYWYGIFKDSSSLVMTYYSGSLYDYSKSNVITEKLANNFIMKSIELLENVHKHKVVHRDIKPHNFMIGIDKELYIIDFGLATVYVDENNNHIKDLSSQKYVIGTPRFTSYNIYNGKESVRRDDLISLGYMYLYLLGIVLPWDSVIHINTCDNNEIDNEIDILHYKNLYRKSKKEWENISELSSNINNSIFRYLKYCYSLPFESNPNYSALKELFG